MRLLNSISLGLVAAMAVNASKIFSCKEKNTMALTFDDGPYEYTAELLDILKKKEIKATFFINAENYWTDLPTDKAKQEIIKNQYSAGHQIASHTWSHEIPSSNNEIKEMMKKFDDFLEDVIGKRPKYFRAPQGNCDDSCISYFEELGYKVIQWDTDTNDWNKSKGVEERVKLVKKFLKKEWAEEKDNYLVLMHDVQKHTVKEIMPWIIENAPFDKYKFVTVAECLGDKDGMYISGKDAQTEDAVNNVDADTNSNNREIGDNLQNVIPNNDDTNKSNLTSSDAVNSFKNVI